MKTEQPSPQWRNIVLLIEDNAEDIELFRLAVTQSGFACKVIAINFAREAIRYLGGILGYGDKTKFPKPTLIVLDLSLPGMDGLEFLLWAKGEPTGTIPPIVVLSSSQLELNRVLTQKFGAKAYFVKSGNLQENIATVKELLSFGIPSNSAEAVKN